MNNQSLLLTLVIVLVIVYVFYPNWLGLENFNPNKIEPEMHKDINASQINGVPNSVGPTWGLDGEFSMGYNMCSKSCCSPQYPPPFDLPIDPLVCGSDKEFVPSSYTCNNGWQDAGCLCMTKDQASFLSHRGNNS